MLLEQFFSVVPPELKLWLADKNPTTLQQAAQLADQYTALHKSVTVSQSVADTQSVNNTESKPVCATFSKKPFGTNNASGGNKNTSDNKKWPAQITCFYCRKRATLFHNADLKRSRKQVKAQKGPLTNKKLLCSRYRFGRITIAQRGSSIRWFDHVCAPIIQAILH